MFRKDGVGSSMNWLESTQAALMLLRRAASRLFLRAAVFLCMVLVDETLSRIEQTFLYSASAEGTSFRRSASRKVLICSRTRCLRHLFLACRFLSCRMRFLAESIFGTWCSSWRNEMSPGRTIDSGEDRPLCWFRPGFQVQKR